MRLTTHNDNSGFFLSTSVVEVFAHRGHDCEAGRSEDGRVFHLGPFEVVYSRKALVASRSNATQPDNI
jgi:hypothetical protein